MNTQNKNEINKITHSPFLKNFIIFSIIILIISIIFSFYYSNNLLKNWIETNFLNKISSKEKKIIIIGSGLAGLSAAIEAQRLGAKVFIIEKEIKIGGNSAKASSGINALNTPIQKKKGIHDSFESFKEDTLNSGGGLSDQELVNILIRNSLPSFEFLTNFGLNLEILSQCGGHSFPRTHRTYIKEGKITNVGFEIISTLYKYITSIPDNIKVITSAKLIKILINHNNEVIGIKYLNLKTNEITELLGDAVILASGGYANDKNGLLKEYFPNISNLPTTNGPFALGEGIKLAKEIGADLVLMDQVQIHPTSFVDPLNPTSETNFLAPEALRGSGGIIINSKGKRFVNELGLREQVTNEIFKNCEKLNNTELIVAYLLLNDKAVEIYQASALSFYKSKGFIKEFNNSEEFAKAFHIDPLIIFQTLINYTNYAHIGEDPFGKKNFPVTFSPNEHLYAMIITPAIHYTMGGLRINSKSQVLNSNLKPIKGLFAAGEVTGGIHGKNRLAGNSLLECIVFGRLSSQTAMNFS